MNEQTQNILSITVASSKTGFFSTTKLTRSNSVLIPPPMGMSNTAHLALRIFIAIFVYKNSSPANLRIYSALTENNLLYGITPGCFSGKRQVIANTINYKIDSLWKTSKKVVCKPNYIDFNLCGL